MIAQMCCYRPKNLHLLLSVPDSSDLVFALGQNRISPEQAVNAYIDRILEEHPDLSKRLCSTQDFRAWIFQETQRISWESLGLVVTLH